MKRLIAAVVCLAVCSPMFGQTFSLAKKDKVDAGFRALGTLHIVVGVADWATTQWALKKYPNLYAEANPVARIYVKNEYVSFAVMAVGLTLLYMATESIYKENKLLGWIVRGAIFIGHSLVLVHNLKLLAERN